MVVEDADAPPDRDQDRADNQGEARVINVLMVEDDYDDFYLIREILKQNSKRQYRLSRALTLEDCVSQVQSTPPDIILLDLGLQDSSGLATLEKLLKSGIQQPVIVLTGVTMKSWARMPSKLEQKIIFQKKRSVKHCCRAPLTTALNGTD